jgi:flavodoxin I
MGKVGLIYATETGNTERVALQIQSLWPDAAVELMNLARTPTPPLRAYTALILGTPTLRGGTLPDHWRALLANEGEDLSGTTIALFGLGDQVQYPDEFVDGLGTLHDELARRGARFVGRWPVSGYHHARSRAQRGSEFVGLALDEVNQAKLTAERVRAWVRTIQDPLRAAAHAAC